MNQVRAIVRKLFETECTILYIFIIQLSMAMKALTVQDPMEKVTNFPGIPCFTIVGSLVFDDIPYP